MISLMSPHNKIRYGLEHKRTSFMTKVVNCKPCKPSEGRFFITIVLKES